MTYARAHLIDSQEPGFYHLISRCVRRAWLCGTDAETGRSFEHRRAWIEGRIASLGTLFAVEIYGYAVMSNHYHLVIRCAPQEPERWSDESVAERWVSLSVLDDAQRSGRLEALLRDRKRLAEIRRRLGSVSWFMRYLNEPLARWANREDGCKGRFWEGRFVSRALLDERAVLACMIYVELNPVRARIADSLRKSVHTSWSRRNADPDSRVVGQTLTNECHALRAVISGLVESSSRLSLTVGQYRCLAEWTATSTAGADAGALPNLPQLSGGASEWMSSVFAHRLKHRRAFGGVQALRSLADRLGQRWVKGIACANALHWPLLA